ncbi:hypothetical protein DV515_00001251, partial [Chloebia gouldiae]
MGRRSRIPRTCRRCSAPGQRFLLKRPGSAHKRPAGRENPERRDRAGTAIPSVLPHPGPAVTSALRGRQRPAARGSLLPYPAARHARGAAGGSLITEKLVLRSLNSCLPTMLQAPEERTWVLMPRTWSKCHPWALPAT